MTKNSSWIACLVGLICSSSAACSSPPTGTRRGAATPTQPSQTQPDAQAPTHLPTQTQTQTQTLPTSSAPCATACKESSVGAGGTGFDLQVNPSDAVGLDADGALVLRQDSSTTASFIWISNTAGTPPTVSKIDTHTQKEVARYVVGAPDPSRTSVSMNGDAYVASRAGMGVTKISGLGPLCPDKNGDGIVTTSNGPTNVLPWGMDECVLWFKNFDQEIRGVAAQDIPGQLKVEPQPDGPPNVTTIPEKHYVWVGASTTAASGIPFLAPFLPAPAGGGSTTPTAYKLDGDTGAVLISTPMPRGAYGFALDGRGMLWLTGGAYWDGNLAFIDTNKCLDAASCSAAPCSVACSTTVCPTTCDGAVKGDILLQPSDTYGITVDCQQRVWLGSSIKRYDPLAPANQRLMVAPASATAGTQSVGGIAVDANGWVWGAAGDVVRIDAATMTQVSVITTPDHGAHGVAVDADGKVWAISPSSTTVHVITPGAQVTDNTVAVDAVQGLDNPYTYSDMTGVQLHLATGSGPGTYRQTFEGCATGDTKWVDFRWTAETPGQTWIVFQVRSADSVDALKQAAWLPLAGSPSPLSTTSIDNVLKAGSQAKHKYVEIKVELYGETGSSNRCGGVKSVSPRVKSLSVRHQCADAVPG